MPHDDSVGVVVTRPAPDDQAGGRDDVDLRLRTDADLRVRDVWSSPRGWEILGRPVAELVHADDRGRFRAAVEACLDTAHDQRLSVSLTCASRPLVAMRLSAVGSRSSRVLQITALLTGDQRVEDTESDDQRNRDAELARTLMDIVPNAMFTKDRRGRFVAANQTLCDFLGVESADEIVGKSDFDFHPPDEAERYWRIDDHIMATGEAVHDLEEVQTRRDGSIDVVRTTKVPIRGAHGEVVGLMGFSTDVTEPRRVRDALAISELRHLEAARASQDGIWDFDVAAGTLYLSPRCAELFGMEVQQEPYTWEQATRHMSLDAGALGAAEMELARQDPARSFRREVPIDDGVDRRWLTIAGRAHSVDGRILRFIGSAADTTEDHLRQERLTYEARHDDLTGLANRRALVEAMDGAPGALISLDLDAFKVVNDSLGHHAGDELLVTVARRLREAVGSKGLLCRFGGDEFAVFLAGEDGEAAESMAADLLDAVSRPFAVAGLEIYTTASIGIVSGAAAHGRAQDVLRDAGTALYEAKERGKGQVVRFEPEMRELAEERLALQMRLRRSVEDMEFTLLYQPILEAASGEVEGVEALLRWTPPGSEVLAPSVFLPYLEETGLIVPVGEWVIEEGCRQLAEWKAAHPRMGRIALNLNVSRRQLGSPQLVPILGAAIDRHGIDPSDVVVEITETAVADWSSSVGDRLAAIRCLGVRLAIDDFGVGQSSLSVLHHVPVDVLKIDRSFTSRIVEGEDEPVTTAVLQLAESMGLATVAEGIEAEHQARWLAGKHCHCLQGFLFSRPLVPTDIPPFLHGHRRTER